jgi:hypothetical protein
MTKQPYPLAKAGNAWQGASFQKGRRLAELTASNRLQRYAASVSPEPVAFVPAKHTG